MYSYERAVREGVCEAPPLGTFLRFDVAHEAPAVVARARVGEHAALRAGTAGHCSPRHQTRFESSFLALHAFL
jgi:hypothetical protein